MRQLVENDDCKILEKYSGKKSNKFKISKEVDSLIDGYITNAQTILNFDILKEFSKLQEKIKNNKSENLLTFKHDIDLLFSDKKDQIYYVEIKYNDDHDTGKFVDINRKFIKTYAFLVMELKKDIMPSILFQ